jgi:hypothetical protein
MRDDQAKLMPEMSVLHSHLRREEILPSEQTRQMSTASVQPSVVLPLIIGIGFTGHRKLADEAKSLAAIHQFMEDCKRRTPGIVCGVSSVAAGGDLLFAETCLRLDIPLRVLLPFPKEQFRSDFDESTWERVERVLSLAISEEVTESGQSRDDGYYECGIETVQQSRVLLALWDGEPSQGKGGTEDVVSFAREQGRPVVWINSTTAAVQYFNNSQGWLGDPELEFLNNLTDSKGASSLESHQDRVRAWFLKIDARANSVAPKIRHLAAIPILCASSATVFTVASSASFGKGPWLAIAACLGVFGGVLPIALRLRGNQVLWTRMRTAAEICRSFLALWPSPDSYNIIGSEVIPELSGMLTSLNFLKLTDRQKHDVPLEEFKRGYRQERVHGQITYFSKEADRSSAEMRRFNITIWGAIGFAAAMNLWAFLGSHVSGKLLSWNWRFLLTVGGAIFFQIATVAGALIVVNDYQRRRDRYKALSEMLRRWDRQIEASRTWPAVLRTATMIERALLAEVIEWRSLIQHQKLPTK